MKGTWKAWSWVGLFALMGCATIIGKGGNQAVRINSNPAGAKFTIYDENRNIINTGTTPQLVSLEKDIGWFEKPVYHVVVEKEGYGKQEVKIKGKVGGWYIGGNFCFGGLLGWLIIDPLTGAMWTLPEEISTNLSEKMSLLIKQKNGLIITLLEDIPMSLLNEIKPHMKLVD